MQTFHFQRSSIKGLVLIDPFLAPDDRGYLTKTFERSIFKANGIDFIPHEELHSLSKKGILRGLHFQWHHSQDKMVHVLSGAVFDVAVDLRAGSDTFGKWEGFYLSAKKRQVLYIPEGCAHGFLALEEHTLFSYLTGSPYDPASDGGIRWDDPQLNIRWPLERVEHVTLSDKDAALPTLEEFLRATGTQGLEVEEP